MNFTTLILLIFTAILAIGSVSKGLNLSAAARFNLPIAKKSPHCMVEWSTLQQNLSLQVVLSGLLKFYSTLM